MLKFRFNNAKLLLIVAATFAGSCLAQIENSLQANCYPGINCEANQLGPQTISLTEATTWTYPSLTVADGTIVVTNGYPLTIYVKEDLTITGKMIIRSYVEGLAPATEVTIAEHGIDGISYDRGQIMVASASLAMAAMADPERRAEAGLQVFPVVMPE